MSAKPDIQNSRHQPSMSSSPSHTRSPPREAPSTFLDDVWSNLLLGTGDDGASERATIGSMGAEPTPGLVPTEDELKDEGVRQAYRLRLLESIGYAPTRGLRIVIRWPARR
jgi:hypothetical protein